MEIIHLVEESELSVKQTLEELNVPCSSFYRWYQNKIPESEKKQIVKSALENP